jgi:hypothetical protein
MDNAMLDDLAAKAARVYPGERWEAEAEGGIVRFDNAVLLELIEHARDSVATKELAEAWLKERNRRMAVQAAKDAGTPESQRITREWQKD